MENLVFSRENKQTKMKMDIGKNFGFFFVVLTGILLAIGTVSAVDFNGVQVTVDGVDALDNAALVAGQTVTVKVYFTSVIDTTDLKVKVDLEGNEVDADEVTDAFEVESGHRYVKVLALKVPYELEDDVSEDAVLNLKIWGGDSIAFTDTFDVRVQRPSYDIGYMSISSSQTVEAGKQLPVTVVLKNVGYNKLNDLYITVSILELNAVKTGYFGDVVSVEDDDNEDLVSGKIFLDVPYEARSGTYTLQVDAKSDDFSTNKVSQITVQNGLLSNVLLSGNQIIVANPTNQLLILKLVPETSGVSLSENLVIVPSGMSKSITFSASADNSKVNVYSKDGQLLDSVVLPNSGTNGGSAYVVLTVVLAIILLVLLAVLVVLITKKPEKKEEFGESYY